MSCHYRPSTPTRVWSAAGPDGDDLSGLTAMEAACPIDELPAELLQEILSPLDWKEQLAVRRVSRRWKAAVDACLTRRQELDIMVGENQDPSLRAVINLLNRMPNLRRLTIDLMLETLDQALAEQLCTSCPHLQTVSLERGYLETGVEISLDEAGVSTLLRRLPGLRMLDLKCSGSKGGFLSLLPAALESLRLTDFGSMDPASFRHLTRCEQLRELHLHRTDGGMLETVLAGCPHLERLTVELATVVYDWYSVLSQCPKLRDLSICDLNASDKYYAPEFELRDVLTACTRLEGLRLDGCGELTLLRPAPGAMGQGDQFRLSRLELGGTEIDEDTLCELADLLPGFRHLEFGRSYYLTEEGLANGLRRFASLQVLQLGSRCILTPGSPVLAALSHLPLEKLLCRIDPEPEALVLVVASLLRQCPKLTLLFLLYNQIDSCQSLANELAADPPMQNDVALALCERMPEDTALLPKNVRVEMYDSIHIGWSDIRWLSGC